MRNRHSFSILL